MFLGLNERKSHSHSSESNGKPSQKSVGYYNSKRGNQLCVNNPGFGIGTYGCDSQVSNYFWRYSIETLFTFSHNTLLIMPIIFLIYVALYVGSKVNKLKLILLDTV